MTSRIPISGPRAPEPRLRYIRYMHRGYALVVCSPGVTRTMIDIDDDLLARAAKELGTTTKKDTVHAALRAALRASAARSLMNRMAENATGTRTKLWSTQCGETATQRTRHDHALFARQISGLPRALARVRHRLEPLMERGLLARCGITDLEFGVSARSREDHRTLGTYRRDALEYVNTPDTVWVRAWEIQEALTDKGFHRSVKIPDLIIAAVAEHHGIPVMHYDQDFERIAAITRQPVEWVVAPGTA